MPPPDPDAREIVQDVPDPENDGESGGLPVQTNVQANVVPGGNVPEIVPVCDHPDPLSDTDLPPPFQLMPVKPAQLASPDP